MDCFRISIASWLIDNGISKGDKVAILSENTPNWVITFWSLVSIGAVCVPILPEFSTAEIDHILKHSETKILFISVRLQQKNPNLEFAFAKVKLYDFTPVTANAKSIL